MANGYLLWIACLTSLFVHSCSELYFLAERLPLQGTKPFPGSPWPIPRSWHRTDSAVTFDPQNIPVTTDLEDCDIVKASIQRFHEFLKQTDESVNPSNHQDNNQEEEADIDDDDDESIVNIHANTTDNITDSNSVEVLQSVIITTERSNRHEHSSSQSGEDDVEYHVDDAQHLSGMTIHIDDSVCPDYPQHGMIEEYNITIDTDIHIESISVWGLIRGLETVQQLMYTWRNKWFINKGHIKDGPRFPYRGLLLDTARHFYPVEILKKNLDVMCSNKLNVFHWHIVDAQSFPYESVKFPELAKKGAFSPELTYSQSDIKDVIEHARLRGIRVLPEFDTPGHAHSWGIAMPELLTPCWSNGQASQANYSYHSERENFDPSKNFTYQFLEEFFDEVKDVFKDNFLHMGMDEAHYMCWESSPNITAFMEDMGFGEDYTLLESYYNLRLLDIVENLQKKAIIYEDPINNGIMVPNTTIIQQWKDTSLDPVLGSWQSYMEAVLTTGYDVIFSSCWYLNKMQNNQDWMDFYNCDPTNINVSEEEAFHILGGEACAWSEFLDEQNILQTLWPRTSAVAERLWSPGNITDVDDAQWRLDQHRCRLIRQGVPARPVLAGYCLKDYNLDNGRDFLIKPYVPTTTAATTTQNTTANTTTAAVTDPIKTTVKIKEQATPRGARSGTSAPITGTVSFIFLNLIFSLISLTSNLS